MTFQGVGDMQEFKSSEFQNFPKRLLLISPQSKKVDAERAFMSPALGIVRIAGYLRSQGQEAEAYDPNLYMLTGYGPSLEEKLAEKSWDFIGFSVLEQTLIEDIQNMYLAKKMCPNAKLFAGGIEAQFNYQTILDKTPCKIVILSEGEISTLMLTEGKPLHEIPGIVFKNDAVPLSQELFNEATNTIKWEENPYEEYWDYYGAKYGDTATEENLKEIYTVRVFSRNRCPIGCKFCSSTNQITWGSNGTVPVISATEDNLIHVIERIVNSHPKVKTIYLTDDDFCIDKPSVIRFCQKAIERDFGDLTFMCFARSRDLNEEMLGWMKKANFRRLNIGIESFSEKVLEEMGKRCNVEHNYQALEMVKKYDIKAFINMILITPETTLDDLETTVNSAIFYAQDDFYHVGVVLAIKPLKGTDFYETNSNYLSAVEAIPETKYHIKRDDMILANDPRVRSIQLKYWDNIDEVVNEKSKQDGIVHKVASNVALIKLNYVKSLIEEMRHSQVDVNGIQNEYSSQILDIPYNELQTVDIPESIVYADGMSQKNN